MNLPVIRRILKDDLQRAEKDLPKWIDALLTPLNEFIDRITSVLRNNITFRDNFSGKVLTVEFTHGIQKTVGTQMQTNASGVIPLSVESKLGVPIQIDSWGWIPKSTGQIDMTFRFSILETTASTHTNTTLDAIATNAINSIPVISVGYYVSGNGIVEGSTIASIASATSVTLSTAALNTTTGTHITISPDKAKVTFLVTTG